MANQNGQPTPDQATIVKGKSPRNALLGVGAIAALAIGAIGFYYQVKASNEAMEEQRLLKASKAADGVDKSNNTEDVDKIIADQQAAAHRAEEIAKANAASATRGPRYRKRVDLISQCANEASRAEFDRKWMAVLLRCADWFSSLPLNPELYREPGGAFRFTIETAFYAMRLAGGQKFGTNLTSEKRRRIEPQYNHAVFLAAVCSGLDEPHRHFVVTRERDMAQWNPSAHGPAATWLGDASYRVGRRDNALPVERMRTGMLAQMLVGPELLGGLDAEVQSELFGAINPSMRPLEAESLTHRVVREAITIAADFDRKAQRAVFEPVQFTVPPAVDVAALLQPVVIPVGDAAQAAPVNFSPANPVAASETGVHAPGQAGGVTTSRAAPAEPAEPAATPAAVAQSQTGRESTLQRGANSAPARSPKSLMDVLDIEPDTPVPPPGPMSSHSGKSGGAADQMGLPFAAVEAPTSVALNPADISAPPGPLRQSEDAGSRAVDDVLMHHSFTCPSCAQELGPRRKRARKARGAA